MAKIVRFEFQHSSRDWEQVEARDDRDFQGNTFLLSSFPVSVVFREDHPPVVILPKAATEPHPKDATFVLEEGVVVDKFRIGGTPITFVWSNAEIE